MTRAFSGEPRLPSADSEIRHSSNGAKVRSDPVTPEMHGRFSNKSEDCSVQQVRDGQKMPGALSRRLIGHLRGDGEPNGETDRPGL